MILRTAYWRDLAARQAFKQFVLAIHGVDFDEWDSGYWDDDYRPYSYFEDGRVVASMCIYTMPAMVNGEACRVAQVSGVGTLPEYRLRGLNRKLHEIALAEAMPDHRFAFLYADDEAIPFYRKCGFSPVAAHASVLPLPPSPAPAPAMEKLDLAVPAVRQALYRVASARRPLSHVFSTHNPKLVMYHLIYRLRDHIWHVPSLDAVVLMRADAGKVILYDILAAEPPRYEDLVPVLAAGGAGEAEFRFPIDRLQAPPATLRELPGHNVHVMGDFPFGAHPVFPSTSQA